MKKYRTTNNSEVTTVLGSNKLHACSNSKEYKEYRALWDKASALDIVTDYPLQIDFELNYSCNYTCPMCTWSVESNKNRGKITWLDFDIFKEIIDDGVDKGLKAIRLNYINEPLIRRDIVEYISYAKSKGVLDVYFSTNGYLLTQELSKQLIKSGLDRIQFSLDAITEETYNKIRQGGSYDIVINNINNFIETRNNFGLTKPSVRVNFVRTKLNASEYDDFVKYWVDRVEGIGLQDLVDVMKFDDLSKVNNSKDDRSNFRCSQPYQHLVVRYNGVILPCCSFYGAELPLGIYNTDKQLSDADCISVDYQSVDFERYTILQAWESSAMIKLRNIHQAGKYYNNEICKRCVESTNHFDETQ